MSAQLRYLARAWVSFGPGCEMTGKIFVSYREDECEQDLTERVNM